ncbi:hypothetical protein [Phenylobacterium sp.]|uniref:hypothetical protein n=1 Tax=Phenylobacterium sp. TaxID=1871053 RepID=UPI001212F547|nr:hypothetical protein [Phenylobacterium sp.]THD61527.1 MAG: hypothetical protein E8A49_11135 [Phenylobacterium sp.]
MRATLRGLLGCQHAALLALTPDERRKCEEQAAAGTIPGRAAPGPKLNFDLHGVFTAAPEPYLQRKPTNGCKARAAGDAAPGPGGRYGGAVGAELGVGCAVPF